MPFGPPVERRLPRGLPVALVTSVLLVAGCGASSGPAADSAAALNEEETVVDPVAAVQAWRDDHEADYRYEWASIAGLYPLEAGTHRVGSDPDNDIVVPHLPPVAGRVVLEAGRVRFDPEPDVAVVRKGARTRPEPGQPPDEPLTGSVVLYDPDQPDEADQPEIAIGSVRLVAHLSGEHLSLRVRDPQSEQARSFLGFSWFPIDDAYRVTGRFIADEAPRELPVLNTYGDVDTYATEGVVEFELAGETRRLRPFTTRPGRLYFVFRDASSGDETYHTARFVYADLEADGRTVIDFNTAYNPPCAFNPYTTCPIPLPENVLAIKVLAGERAYPVEVP